MKTSHDGDCDVYGCGICTCGYFLEYQRRDGAELLGTQQGAGYEHHIDAIALLALLGRMQKSKPNILGEYVKSMEVHP